MLPSIFGENLFDDFFEESFDKPFFDEKNPLYGKHAKNLMKTDVQETGDGYTVSIDLPGFRKDEVNVALQDGYLTVSAAKGLDRDQQDKDGRYLRQERYAGACSRSFYVGDIQPAEVQCKYESGVLTLHFPKRIEEKKQPSNRIEIQ